MSYHLIQEMSGSGNLARSRSLSYYERVLHTYEYPCEGTKVFCFVVCFCFVVVLVFFLEIDSKLILARSVLISSLNLSPVYMHCDNVVRLLVFFCFLLPFFILIQVFSLI